MAEVLNTYTKLLEQDVHKAIDFVKQNKTAVNEIFTGADDELVLNAKVRYLEKYMSDHQNIMQQVIGLTNTFTSHSAIICNFLIKSKGKMTLEQEKVLEAKLVENATRFSVIYFLTQKADEISNLPFKDKIENDYLSFVQGVVNKSKSNLKGEELSQLKRFLDMEMQRSETSNKAFDIARNML